jgi:hypothetical protein
MALDPTALYEKIDSLVGSDKLTEGPEMNQLLKDVFESVTEAILSAKTTLQPLLDKLPELVAVEAKLIEIEAVYADLANIDAVAGDLTEINAVHAKLTELTELHAQLSKLVDLHTDLAKLVAVHGKLTEIEGVYAKLTEIAALYAKLTEITAVYNNLSTIDAVHAKLEKVESVADNMAAVLAVDENHGNINTVAEDINLGAGSKLAIVAADIADVTAVANNIADVVAVNDNKTNIDAVADDLALGASSKIGKVATDITNVNTVATDIANVNLAANKMAEIEAAPGAAAAADAAQGLAETAQTAAETAQGLAEKYATEAEDIQVEAGKYSAFHYSEKARKIVEDVGTGLLFYGVEIDSAVSSPTLTRIGNTTLHQTLPVHNNIFAFLQNDDGTINYKLNPTLWAQKLTGGASNLDGTDGQVMIHLPGFYYKSEVVAAKERRTVSEFDLPGYLYSPPVNVSAYLASLMRSLLKLSSVKNTTADYRGGNNTSAWDAQANSLLGEPATSLSRTNFTTYARNRGAGWEQFHYHAWWKIFWLFTIEYATLNSQAAVNNALDGNGYRQGGLGNGVTNLDSNKWNHFSSYNPVIPSGASDSLASGTGEVAFTMPFEFDVLPPAFVNIYSAATAYTVGQYTSFNYLLYRCILNSTGNTPTNATFFTQVNLYKGVYNEATTYLVDDYVSSGSNLYRCILESTGNAVTNTTYFVAVTRTTTNVNRYRGIEMPFGHIWTWCEGVNIRSAANSEADPTHKAYISFTPAHWNAVNYTNYQLAGELPRADGYIKQMIPGQVLPLVAGGSGAGSAAFWCDYYYQSIPASGVSLRALLLGGHACFGAHAGFGCSLSYYSPSNSYADFGSRLCFIPA